MSDRRRRRDAARADRVLPGAWRLRLPLPWPGVPHVVLPVRVVVPGVKIETDLGSFDVYETPGHAPAHVCLHEPRRGLLVSGDHLLGRVSLYYDYGYTPDPAGEFLASLDTVDE